MRYPIGTQFIKVGRKHKGTWTVTNYHVTTDLQGNIVKARYVAECSFLGQALIDSDVCEATIARGLLK